MKLGRVNFGMGILLAILSGASYQDGSRMLIFFLASFVNFIVSGLKEW